MRPLSQFLRLTAAVMCGGLLLAGPAHAQKAQTKKGAYPAAEGFDQAGSDPKAIAIADKVMNAMGGYDAWRNTRYLAWSFFGGQYQIWDKYTGDFHWEKDTLVANYNLNYKKGRYTAAAKIFQPRRPARKYSTGSCPFGLTTPTGW
ncbi:hypothetical protein [Hymenobacter sp. HDW8]|uniref:hypothetical protein n=1 Tax=Hymenobacter sp. HDW8 TaxID=2714932 RepID=UPI001409B6C8|nr:hypothetical protein [Hymenobacter sp. HDW8]QIL77490.1 hypothetical protein G7064_17810 [Hymenobacter sp. HDW8]